MGIWLLNFVFMISLDFFLSPLVPHLLHVKLLIIICLEFYATNMVPKEVVSDIGILNTLLLFSWKFF